MKPQDIEQIIDNHQGELGALISILEEVQTEYHYLPEEALRMIAGRTGRSLVDIYGVATFYKTFSLKPRGKHLVSVCLGTACHVQGGDFLLNALRSEIGISPNETTPDGRFDLERVACLGCCALAPVVMINDDIFSNMSVVKLKEILNRYE